MSFATPLDLVIATVLAVRRFGLARTMLGGLLLMPVYLWSQPPVACGCFRPLFVRCVYSLRYYATLKSDLKNVAALEEIHFAEHGTYAYDWRELGFTQSEGVRVTILASQDSWAAVATHSAIGEGEGCAIYVGGGEAYVAEVFSEGRAGEVVCAK